MSGTRAMAPLGRSYDNGVVCLNDGLRLQVGRDLHCSFKSVIRNHFPRAGSRDLLSSPSRSVFDSGRSCSMLEGPGDYEFINQFWISLRRSKPMLINN